MGTVLFTYEFGAGLGHLTPLISVAGRLATHHRLVFALRDLEPSLEPLRRALGERAELRQGVVWKPKGSRLARTLADALWAAGFGDRDMMGEVVRQWQAILAEVQPDVIVSDFSPGLRLAAQDRWPMIEVGYGYTVPPPGRPLPPLRPWDPRVPPDTRAREFQALAWANEVRGELGGAPVEHLADLFQGDETFVCTLPELDPYEAYRTKATAAPLVPRIRPGPPFAQRTGADIFTYLHGSHPRLNDVITALSASERDAILYVSSASPEAIARKCGRNVRVLRRPADYRAILPQSKLAVHHGGLGTAHTALAAATPQLMLPVRLEWQVNARGVVALGAGRQVNEETSAEELGVLMAEMTVDPAVQGGAVRAAARLRDAHGQDPLGLIAEACEWRLSRSGGAPAIETPSEPAAP